MHSSGLKDFHFSKVVIWREAYFKISCRSSSFCGVWDRFYKKVSDAQTKVLETMLLQRPPESDLSATSSPLPTAIQQLSQYFCGVFTAMVDLCSTERAMSRRIVCKLNTSLQRSWMWTMYGPVFTQHPSVWRSRTLDLSGSAGSELRPCLTGD